MLRASEYPPSTDDRAERNGDGGAITELSRIGRLVPESGFHLAAFVGAGMAGYLLSGYLGRNTLAGALALVAVTLLGALLGSLFLDPLGSPAEAAMLGLLLVAEVAPQEFLLKSWIVTMIALHFSAERLRRASGP